LLIGSGLRSTPDNDFMKLLLTALLIPLHRGLDIVHLFHLTILYLTPVLEDFAKDLMTDVILSGASFGVVSYTFYDNRPA
jgi:uncharacterized membrane protein